MGNSMMIPLLKAKGRPGKAGAVESPGECMTPSPDLKAADW